MSTFIGQLVGFVIIVAIVVKWVVPPVRKLMNTQQEAVRAALMESKAAADKLANADAEHAKAVEDARAKIASGELKVVNYNTGNACPVQ